MTVLAGLALLLGLRYLNPSQQIRILVVEARHGKPVPHECINVSFGSWHGTDLIAATGENGIATLKMDGDNVVAEAVPNAPCQRGWATMKHLDPSAPADLSLVPDWYISCQYSAQQVKDPAWRSATPSERIPRFSINDILGRGVVAANTCSKLAPQEQPGELILVVRRRTFWEGMRS